jgi:prepilin peptidase dependent protein B
MFMNRRTNKGFSVVELMIGLALGLVVVLGLERIFVASFAVNVQTINVTNLNQQLRATMEVMTRDIRRAGYWANSLDDIGANDQTNPFVGVTAFDTILDDTKVASGVAAECIVYGYDRDNEGDFTDTNEWRGFRFDPGDGTNGTIEVKTSGLQSQVFDPADDTVTGTCAVGAGTWTDFIDPDRVVIDSLTFTLNEREVIIDDECPDAATEFVVFVRDVDIALTAHLTSDAAISRTLRDSIRVRNDRIDPERTMVCPP